MDDNETWLKMCKITLLRKTLASTGSPLNDKYINLAQIMFKHQFSILVLPCCNIKVHIIRNGIQIFHCNYHWFTAAKFYPNGPLKVYDSVFMSITEVRSLLFNKFVSFITLNWLQCKSKPNTIYVGFLQLQLLLLLHMIKTLVICILLSIK